MKCDYSREILAGYAGGDLPESLAESVKVHLTGCMTCQDLHARIQESRSVLRSLREETASEVDLAAVHQGAMSRIETARSRLGWMTLERFLLMGLRRPRYATAAVLFVAIVSATLLGQIRQSSTAAVRSAAVFEGQNTLVRPERYREWVFVGSSIGLSYAANPAPSDHQESQRFHNVYIDPASYRHYEKTREFPEGTVMVLEIASAELKSEPGLQGSYEKEFVALEASVKDTQRLGGWGYFGFTGDDGKLKATAQPFPDSAGCRRCHEERAETDHVFTQFYPVLRAAARS